MERSETTEIDQALFGYADGHRQLASSTRLPARDMYELASRSDLVPGARLDPKGSYITGFSLPESRAFAFVKTWLAPEMPRPGCVWSHALLLPRSFLSTQVDLSILDTFFHRPEPASDRQIYTNKLRVRRFAKGAPADPSLVKRVLASYYGSSTLMLDEGSKAGLERAVLALWSQQWPKLRAEFEFRTALKSSIPLNKGLSVRLGTGPDSSVSKSLNSNWMEFAVADAVATEITPLRRFLWRYGKDIVKPRDAFVDLVNLYALKLSTTQGLSVDQIVSVFERLPGEGNGTTIKRDLLGASEPPLALIPRVRAEDVVDALVRIRPLENKTLTEPELRKSVRSYGSSAIPILAQSLEEQNDQYCAELDVVFEDITEAATLKELHDDRTPAGFALHVLSKKPELIGGYDLDRLPAQSAEQLLSLVSDSAVFEKFFVWLLRYPPTIAVMSTMREHPTSALRAAISASIAQSIASQWLQELPKMSGSLLNSERFELKGMRSLSHALQVFDFPLSPAIPAANWWAAAQQDEQGTSSDATIVMGFVLVRSFQEGLSGNIDLVSSILPQVRASALSNNLPEKIRLLLDSNLPRVSDNWDLNKRLLKVLRRSHRDGIDVSPILLQLSLSDAELAYVLDEKADEAVSFNFAKLFWPWG